MRGLPIAALSVVLLLGCSGIKTYPNPSPRNLHIQTQIEGAVAELDIYRVNADCRTEYRGRVSLDKPRVEIGISGDGLYYLDFLFVSKAFLSPSVSVVRYDTLLQPRRDRRYDVRARYVDSIYSVVIREVAPGGSTGREIERAGLGDCGKSGRNN